MHNQTPEDQGTTAPPSTCDSEQDQEPPPKPENKIDRILFRFIWRYSKKEQLSILALTVLSFPVYFLSLTIPKSIVNLIADEEEWLESGTRTFFQIKLPFAQLFREEGVVLFAGIDLTQLPTLFLLSLFFLLLVILNSAFKYVVNIRKGKLGERMLRRLRYFLADHILRFPRAAAQSLKPSEVASMVKDEVEPLGGFIGDSITTPVFYTGQLLTGVIFMLVQNIWLGLIAVAVVGYQGYLIPRLRRPVIALGRQRQLKARQLAGRVGELIDGITEIHTHDTSHYERSEISTRLAQIFYIRFEIFNLKFFAKFVNGLLSQLTPFVFYLLGGYLALTGRLDIGSLVASITAYAALPAPVRELITWDQQRNDVQVKFEQVISQFVLDDLLDPSLQPAEPGVPPPLQGEIVAQGLRLSADGQALLAPCSFVIPAGKHVALLGRDDLARSDIALVMAGLMEPEGGSLRIGQSAPYELPESWRGRRIAYVSSESYLFSHSIEYNILYGLRHYPEVGTETWEKKQKRESQHSGNSPFDSEANWINYEAGGFSSKDEMHLAMRQILDDINLAPLVYRAGLRHSLPQEMEDETLEQLLKARTNLHQRLETSGITSIDFYHPQRYARFSSLAENLLFGSSVDPSYALANLSSNSVFVETMREAGFSDRLIQLGCQITRAMAEIFSGLPADHPFFSQYSFISQEELPRYIKLADQVEKSGVSSLSPSEFHDLFSLPLDYIEPQHRLGLIDEDIEKKIVAARGVLSRKLAAMTPAVVETFDPECYNKAASVQDNLLFGRSDRTNSKAEEQINDILTKLLDELGLRETVISAGLQQPVGAGGRLLPVAMRQKIALARALLRNPDHLILDRNLSAIPAREQQVLLERIRSRQSNKGLFVVLDQFEYAADFDYLLYFEGDALSAQGPPATVMASCTALMSDQDV